MPHCINCGAYAPGSGPGDPETHEWAERHSCPPREAYWVPWGDTQERWVGPDGCYTDTYRDRAPGPPARLI